MNKKLIFLSTLIVYFYNYFNNLYIVNNLGIIYNKNIILIALNSSYYLGAFISSIMILYKKNIKINYVFFLIIILNLIFFFLFIFKNFYFILYLKFLSGFLTNSIFFIIEVYLNAIKSKLILYFNLIPLFSFFINQLLFYKITHVKFSFIFFLFVFFSIFFLSNFFLNNNVCVSNNLIFKFNLFDFCNIIILIFFFFIILINNTYNFFLIEITKNILDEQTVNLLVFFGSLISIFYNNFFKNSFFSKVNIFLLIVFFLLIKLFLFNKIILMILLILISNFLFSIFTIFSNYFSKKYKNNNLYSIFFNLFNVISPFICLLIKTINFLLYSKILITIFFLLFFFIVFFDELF